MNSSYLKLMLASGVGPRTLLKILTKLQERQETIADFFSHGPTELRREFGLRETSITAISQDDDTANDYLVDLNEKGIHMLAFGQPGYPIKLYHALGNKTPPLLFYWGNLDLLNHCTVGFCGVRDISAQGLNAVTDTATQLARAKVNVISGHARGTDLAAHKAALEVGGETTIVIPEGILSFQMRADLKNLTDRKRVLIISQFPPRLPWRVHNAMTRNETICGLADALVVIESKLKGGTFAAGKTAMRLKIPMFVVEYADPAKNATGNAYFIEHGAIPLRRSRETGRANVQPMLTIITKSLSCLPMSLEHNHKKYSLENYEHPIISNAQPAIF